MRIFFICLIVFLLPPKISLALESAPTPADMLVSYELDYYLQVFNYVMDSNQETFIFHWSSNSGNGNISVGKEYLSKSKTVCRNFADTFEITRPHGEATAAGCKRLGANGWCRVHDGDAHTCALESPNSAADKILDSTSSAIDKGTEFLNKTTDWLGN